tara:strand:- start:51 stop:395 length:345 start_codon:yes stop_codon:yes gene_type:complete
MKKFLFSGLTLSFLASFSDDEDFTRTNQDSLFSLTSETALKTCGGKSGILENENEEIIKIEIKYSYNKRDKNVELIAVETDKKGGKYKIISCLPKKGPEDSIIQTIKTNYQLNL